MKSILIDHDDSFTYNLQHWLRPLHPVEVINHRDLGPDLKADFFILSPGPKTPRDYPQVLEFINQLPQSTPVYGVCLGLQMMVHLSDGQISPYSPPLHGKKSRLNVLSKEYSFLNNTEVARYHSLHCSGYDPEIFETLAISQEDQTPMWLKHRHKKWMGVQFHPESFLTEKADIHLQFLKNWLNT